MMEAVKDLRTLAQEGTIDERRMLVRAFAKEIRLDPQTGEGRAQVFMLPDLSAAPRFEPATEKSSLIMVAGARYVAEKKHSAARIEFTFRASALRILSVRRTMPATSLMCA